MAKGPEQAAAETEEQATAEASEEAALEEPPLLAVLLQKAARPELLAGVPEGLVAVEAAVRYKGEECGLFLLKEPRPEGTASSAAAQLLRLHKIVDKALGSLHEQESFWAFPLNTPAVARAIVAKQLKTTVWWRDILRWLSILPPDPQGDFITSLKQQYGDQVGLFANASFFYAQALWCLLPFCVVGMIVDSSDLLARFRHTSIAVVLWSFVVTAAAWYRFASQQQPRSGDLRTAESSKYQDLPPHQLWLRMLFLGVPAMCLFFCAVFLIFAAVTALVLHIAYVWGDCLNPALNPPEWGGTNLDYEDPCRDASRKHGFLGWLAEFLCDMLLVVCFEILFPVAEMLAKWLADMVGHKYEIDRQGTINVILVILSCFESLGFRACLGALFVPQFVAHVPGTRDEPPLCKIPLLRQYCDMQSDLDYDRRLWLFEKLTKGPFCVAPFIGIVLKVIVPKVASLLSVHSHRPALEAVLDGVSHSHGRYILAPGRFLSRLLGCIFAYHGGNVGGLTFVAAGWQFEQLTVVRGTHVPEEQAGEKDLLKRAIVQFCKKPFEANMEILELKVNFVGVVFFAPLMPLGVVFTLLAKVLEVRFDLLKMTSVRRRCSPRHDLKMGTALCGFFFCASLSAVGWHAGLWMLVYNETVYTWGVWKYVVAVSVCVWMFLSIILAYVHSGFQTTKAKDVMKQSAEGTVDASLPEALHGGGVDQKAVASL